MIFPSPFIEDILETERSYKLLAQGSGLGKWDFMERQSTRKCEQLELHVILVACCWRNFCLDCSSDSCLDVLEWKSAPNVPRDKPKNCQKTLSFLSPRILNSQWTVPIHPLHKKYSSAITVLCSATLQKTSNSPQKAPKWDSAVSNCPDILCHTLWPCRA